MHYLEECLIESHDENHEVFMMKTIWLSYLHLFNILLSQVEFLNRIVEFSFSTWRKFLSSTFQLDATWIQKSFNLTQHFSSQVLDLNLSTRLNAISLMMSDEWIFLLFAIFLSQTIFRSFKSSWSLTLSFISLSIIFFWLLMSIVVCTSYVSTAKIQRITHVKLAISFAHVWVFFRFA